jgi:propanol-preferring alcohol dehydrogenase
MGGTDGTCRFCTSGAENLCDHPIFTGYTVNGGYAEYALARADFVHPLPADADPIHVAPLLCAGIIGFRSLRVAEVQPGDRVGLFGFGSSASLAIKVLQHWGCQVYVVTRGEGHRAAARAAGAAWVGDESARPPIPLDRAITFAPAGSVVVHALSCLRKGGIVAINAIHLDQMPAFDYDSLLWGERQIRSVANMTRQDARDFLQHRRRAEYPAASKCVFPGECEPGADCRSRRNRKWPRRHRSLTVHRRPPPRRASASDSHESHGQIPHL